MIVWHPEELDELFGGWLRYIRLVETDVDGPNARFYGIHLSGAVSGLDPDKLNAVRTGSSLRYVIRIAPTGRPGVMTYAVHATWRSGGVVLTPRSVRVARKRWGVLNVPVEFGDWIRCDSVVLGFALPLVLFDVYEVAGVERQRLAPLFSSAR